MYATLLLSKFRVRRHYIVMLLLNFYIEHGDSCSLRLLLF